MKMTTWDELSLAQQMILEAARKHNVIVATDRDGVLAPYEWPHAAFEKFITDGYLEQFGIGTSYYTRYRLTPAGRALLPAPTLTPQALDAAIYGTSEYWQQMSSASIEAHTETLERVKELEAEVMELRQFKQEQTRVVTIPSADAHGYSEETVLLSDMLSAENAKLEAENARLREIIIDMDKARLWGGYRLGDTALDALKRLETRIKKAMEIISQ